MDSYAAAIQFLYGRINYERADVQAYSNSDFKLDRMRQLLMRLGQPQERIAAVHVAGTKGKGSTCSMIAAMLAAAGYRVGLYISPHISVFEERMTVNGVRPSPAELVDLVNRLRPVVDEMDRLPGQMQPTYFELATAIAWIHFVDRGVDFAVLETGLGGRLDSTNICRPKVCVITNVSRDHTHILGSTIRQIAWEKAGIIKPEVPIVCGVTHPDALSLIEQIAAERAAPLTLLGRDLVIQERRLDESTDGPDGQDEHVPVAWADIQSRDQTWIGIPIALRGAHQAGNTALALGAIDQLRRQGVRVSDMDIREGLRRVEWPGRVEVAARHPTVIIDAAHNWESARALLATLNEEFRARRRLLIFAATRDKDVAGILRQLIPAFDTLVFTRYLDNPRSVPVEELQTFLQAISHRQAHLAETPAEAWAMAKRLAGRDDLIAITGSFFLVAELRDRVLQESRATSK